jgi:hypothetical protein
MNMILWAQMPFLKFPLSSHQAYNPLLSCFVLVHVTASLIPWFPCNTVTHSCSSTTSSDSHLSLAHLLQLLQDTDWSLALAQRFLSVSTFLDRTISYLCLAPLKTSWNDVGCCWIWLITWFICVTTLYRPSQLDCSLGDFPFFWVGW